MFAIKSGGTRGQARAAYLVAAVCLGIAIVIPALFGGSAERIYLDSIAQLARATHAVRLDSYRRGWFSSQAIVSVATGRGEILLVQHVHHGPLGFYNGWHIAFPVAAVVDTDPPPALQSDLDQVFGDAPIVISTVARMGGTLDTYITRAATERADPAHKLTTKFSGLKAEVHLSRNAYTLRGEVPGITAAGAFGEAGMTGLTLRGESHRHVSGLWLGDGSFNIGRVNYNIAGRGTHTSVHGLVQNIGLSAITEIRNDRLAARQILSVARIAGGALKLGPINLVSEIANVPLQPIEQFRNAAASISRSASDQQAQSLLLQEKMIELFVALVKESPVLSINLHVASPDGEAVGKATFEISPDLANDPLVKANSDRKGIVPLAWKKYGHASAEVTAPAEFLAQLASANQLQQLEQSGLVTRDGANYVCRATFKDGEWLINGHPVKPPAAPDPTDPSGSHS